MIIFFKFLIKLQRQAIQPNLCYKYTPIPVSFFCYRCKKITDKHLTKIYTQRDINKEYQQKNYRNKQKYRNGKNK